MIWNNKLIYAPSSSYDICMYIEMSVNICAKCNCNTVAWRTSQDAMNYGNDDCAVCSNRA